MKKPTICAECRHYLRYCNNPIDNGRSYMWSCDLCQWGAETSMNIVIGKIRFVRSLPSCYDVNNGSCWGFEEWTENEKQLAAVLRYPYSLER